MHRKMWVGTLGAIALSASVAGAQYRAWSSYNNPFENAPVHVGLSVGAGIPTGSLAERLDPGGTIDGNVAFPLGRRSPIWLQFDMAYAYSSVNRQTLQDFGVGTGIGSMLSGTANLLVNLTNNPRTRVVPYLIGGGGVYSRHVELDNYSGSSNDVCDPDFEFCENVGTTTPVMTRTETVGGVDGGAGLRIRMRRVNFLLEARYETAFTKSTNTAYIPVTFGIEF